MLEHTASPRWHAGPHLYNRDGPVCAVVPLVAREDAHTLLASRPLPEGAGFGHQERGGQVTVDARLSGGSGGRTGQVPQGRSWLAIRGVGRWGPTSLKEGGTVRPALSTYMRYISCL